MENPKSKSSPPPAEFLTLARPKGTSDGELRALAKDLAETLKTAAAKAIAARQARERAHLDPPAAPTRDPDAPR